MKRILGHISILWAFLIFVQAPLAHAEIRVETSAAGLTVDVRDGSLLETAKAVADHLGIELDGSIANDKTFSASLRGNTKQIVDVLFGAENYMMVYEADQLSGIVVIDGSRSSLLEGLNPVSQVSVARSSAGTSSSKAESENAQPIVANNKPVRKVGTDVTGFQSQLLATQQSSSFAPKSPSGSSNPVGSPSDLSELQKQTARNLEGLVKALNALCPPGKTC